MFFTIQVINNESGISVSIKRLGVHTQDLCSSPVKGGTAVISIKSGNQLNVIMSVFNTGHCICLIYGLRCKLRVNFYNVKRWLCTFMNMLKTKCCRPLVVISCRTSLGYFQRF